MRQSLDHLPPSKQQEIRRITGVVRKAAKVEMIILFGSHARGDWVEDRYMEDHILYEYTSDYDILIIVRNEEREKDYKIWRQIQDQIERDSTIKTPVSLLVDNIDFVNAQLAEGRYFYMDIQREGILLFDSHRYRLSEPKTLTSRQRRVLAEEDYVTWLQKARVAFQAFAFHAREHADKEEHLKKAAFELHQICESLLICFLLVRTGYRAKTHDLEKLLRSAVRLDVRFQDIISRTTAADEQLFTLLKKAYVDARYSKHYVITKEDLETLHGQLTSLQQLVERACAEFLEGL